MLLNSVRKCTYRMQHRKPCFADLIVMPRVGFQPTYRITIDRSLMVRATVLRLIVFILDLLRDTTALRGMEVAV